MRNKISRAVEVFRLGLRSLEPTSFDSRSNLSVFSIILRDLYLATTEDAAFSIIASAFMGEAHETITGSTDVIHFYVERSGRGDSLIITAEEEPALSFALKYPDLLLRERDDWHTYFMDMASRASERTTCCSGRKVGAVFVKDKVPMMGGFNGVPTGFPHPTSCARLDAGCASGEGLDLCPCNHAEANAINLSAKHGVNLFGSTLYCTTRPCFQCMGNLAVVGVKEVIYRDHYPHAITDDVARHAGIVLSNISEV